MRTPLTDKLNLFDPGLPLERARTIPSLWYTDAEIHDAERRHVFGASWQCVGRVDQLPAAGSFFTADVAGEPLLVVRDAKSRVRGFYNVCRHRAARVEREESGCASRFRCPYHGWTYDLTGALRGTPEFDGVAEFPRAENGLVPVAVAEWGPFVFAHLADDPPPLAEFLAPMPERAAVLCDEQWRHAARRDYRLACNWKVFVDNFLDGGYHINSVHPGLAGVIDYPHYRTELGPNTSVQISPLRAADTKKGDVGKVRGGDAGYYWWVFPNLMVNLYAGVMDTNLVVPDGPDACRVVFDFYFADGGSPPDAGFMEQSIAVAHQIQLEDVAISEDVQRGLHSRSFDRGRFSVRREGPGYHFHQLLARALRPAAGV